MSGYCGQFNRDGRPATTDDLAPAMDALSHHGRDGHGVWSDGPVAFGHQMLHVTPESVGETLPGYKPQPGLAITGDFRLDNREELLNKLGVPREQWPGLPDSAIILLAYERWGAACVVHLLGDFAFAVWDEAARHLFCARDFIGAKPFYYHATGHGFYFASDITGLMAFPAVSDELDLRYVRSYLEILGFNHLEYSFYKDVRKLPPGHTLTISNSMLAKECYWSAAESPPIHYKSDEEYFEHLRALLDEAVAARLRSAFPVGSHLSGGLDSSTVAVLAARQLWARVETPHHGFSWSPPPAEHEFPLADTDERAYVQMICEAESIVPVYTPSPPEDLLTAFLWDITRYPFHTLIYEISTSRIAEAMGIRVMLSGWGGDETVAFNGRGYFADLLRRGRWITMTRELALRTRLHEDIFWGSFKSRAILPLLPEWVIRRARPTLAGILYKPLPVKLLEPEFAALLSRTQLYPRLNTRERPGARKNQIRLINNGHLTYRLESWEINGGHNGIEYRYPLLDKRVVEFSLGVPEYLFHYRGWKRYLLREATNGILPAEVRWKKNKNEPAMSKASQSGASEALSSLYQIFNDRRTEIKRAAYINDEALLSRIQKLLEEQKIPPYDEVFRVIWLANLNRSA